MFTIAAQELSSEVAFELDTADREPSRTKQPLVSLLAAVFESVAAARQCPVKPIHTDPLLSEQSRPAQSGTKFHPKMLRDAPSRAFHQIAACLGRARNI